MSIDDVCTPRNGDYSLSSESMETNSVTSGPEPTARDFCSIASPSETELRFDDFIATLQTLIREPSVVGTEDSFFRVVRRELEEVGAQVTYYQGHWSHKAKTRIT